MTDLYNRRVAKLNRTKVLTKEEDFSGTDIQTFRMQNGSRVLFYLDIEELTGTLALVIENAGDLQQTFKTLFSNTYSSTGQFSIPLTDVQKFFSCSIVASGTATYSLSVTAADGSTSNLAEDSLASIDSKIVHVDTDNINISSSVLPAGAATEAKQDVGNTSLASIDSKISASPSQEHVTAVSPHSVRLSDGSSFYKATTPADTQPVNVTQFGGNAVVTGTGNSGNGIPRVTVSNDSSITNITGTVSLPTGASTSANQTNGTQKSQVVDGSGNVQPSGDVASRGIFTKLTDGTNTTTVKAASTAAQAADPSAVVALSPNSPVPAGSNNIGSITNITGTVSLPTGASTSANQTNGSQKTQVVDASGNVQNAGDVASRALFTKNTDGTNIAAVKAASTAAVVTDPALVVAVSPNNTVAVTQATASNLNAQVVGNVASGASDSGNPVKAGSVFNTTLPTVTNGQRVDQQADANGRQIVAATRLDGYKATYHATSTFTAANTATDIFTLTGSSTKTIRISRIGISATRTTQSIIDLVLLKRSTANTGGTSTNLSEISNDSNNAAATATALSYTANPTTGTLVGNLRNIKFLVPVPGVGGNTSAQTELIELFGDKFGQAIVLRGTGEVFAVNLAGVTVAGNSFSIWIEWTEE